MLGNKSALLLRERDLWNEKHDKFVGCIFLSGCPLYEKSTDEGLATARIESGDDIPVNSLLKDFLLISAWYQAIVTGGRRFCGHRRALGGSFRVWWGRIS